VTGLPVHDATCIHFRRRETIRTALGCGAVREEEGGHG
jgi:hypothetical protein